MTVTGGLIYGLGIIAAIVCLVWCAVDLGRELRAQPGLTEREVQAQLYGRSTR